MINSTISFLITISILVTFHEFGHFIVARLCGVRVECFSIGFGKKLWSHVSKSGTEYAISMIPLGGYVKMLNGHNNSDISQQDISFAFDHKSILKRFAIILAGPLANFILAFVLFWIIFQIGVIRYPIVIEQILPNTPAASVNIPLQSEIKAINGKQIETWQDVNMILISQIGKDFVDIRYQTDKKDIYDQTVNIKNWRFDIEKESAVKAFGLVPAKVIVYPIIRQIKPNSAAEAAGLKEGDEIVSYNASKFDNWENFSALVRTAQSITLGVKRGDQFISVNLEPKRELNAKGQLVGIAGIFPSNNTIVKQYGIVGAFVKGFEQTTSMVKLVVQSFYQLLTGELSLKNLSGPVGIAQSAGQSASNGVVPYLFFLACISISLGVMNLIPLPMLDGGHILFLTIEKLKGTPLSDAKQVIFYRIGFILVITTMGIAFFNDFIRLL